MINFEDMKLGEIEEVELLSGKSLDAMFEKGMPKGRSLRALYFVAMKRDNPEYKFEDTANITQSVALKLVGGVDPKAKG